MDMCMIACVCKYVDIHMHYISYTDITLYIKHVT